MSKISPKQRRSIAAAMGIHEQYLYAMLTRRRQVPIERCPDIERLSGGLELCEDLRPDVPWTRLSDAAWPWHKSGRPVIDMARPDVCAERSVDRAAA